jgi:hypothetical protein
MYESVCPDIFKGGKDRALESLDKLKTGDDIQDFMECIINLSTDYAWIMVALAKLYNGEDLLTIIEEKWNTILATRDNFAKEKAVVQKEHPTLYMYWKTIHMLASTYIERCFQNVGTDTLYHPYGMPHYMACGVRMAYDFVSFLARDADGDYSQFSFLEDELFSDMIVCSDTEYEKITAVRLKFAVETETVTPNVDYKYMFTSNMSLKEFRSMLLIMINIDMLKRRGPGDLQELINAIQDGGILDIISMDGRRGGSERRGRGRSSIPGDIEEMFDD